jgi:hypothetical protein
MPSKAFGTTADSCGIYASADWCIATLSFCFKSMSVAMLGICKLVCEKYRFRVCIHIILNTETMQKVVVTLVTAVNSVHYNK